MSSKMVNEDGNENDYDDDERGAIGAAEAKGQWQQSDEAEANRSSVKALMATIR